MKRVIFSAYRKLIFSFLTLAGLTLLFFLWKGVLPEGASSASKPALASSVSTLEVATSMPPMPLPQLYLFVPGMEFPDKALIGEEFCYTARFQNLPGGGVGYGPYVQIVLPPGFTLSKASMPGVCDTGKCNPLSDYSIPFEGPLNDDPYSPITPTPPPNSVYIVKAPIGSQYSDDPDIDLKICIKVDENVALGVPLSVCQTPIFQYGALAIGGSPIKGTQQCLPVTPNVVILNKRAADYPSNKLAPQPTVEVPTGQCNAVTYELVANIADTRKLDAIRIEDKLPPGMTLVANSVTILNATGSTSCTNTSVNFVCADIPTDTGTPGIPPFDKEDIIIQYRAFVNSNVLSTSSCASATLLNEAKLNAQHNNVVIPEAKGDLLVEVEHITLQKYASGPDPNDPLHVMPGDTVNYKFSFQVSQGITVTNAKITDVMPNGIDFLTTGPQFATLMCPGSQSIPVAINQSLNSSDGTKTLTMTLGTLTSCVNCMLTFSARVEETYRLPKAGQPVLASDSLIPICDPLNPSALKCTKIDYSLNGQVCMDDTAGGVIVKPTQIEKELVTPMPPEGFNPGDSVTFKLKMCVPSGDTKDIEFTDYLPSPAFDVASATGFMITQTAGPNLGLSLPPPTFPGLNSIKFKILPTLVSNNNPSQMVCFEVKFTVSVTTEPFVDDLFLTNRFVSKNVKTDGTSEGHFTGVVIRVRAPKLKITKGVFSSDNQAATITPPPPATQPTPPVDGDITGSDANDTVTFYITVTNEGGAPAHGVKITDLLPKDLLLKQPPFVMPVLGPTPSAVGCTGGCPSATTPIPANTNLNIDYGANILLPGESWVLKLELMIPPMGLPCRQFTNKASVIWSSASAFDVIPPIITTPFPEKSDTATITTASPMITKFPVFIDYPQFPTPGHQVAIGATVQYQATIKLPEGKFTGVMITDTLEPGLSFVNVFSVSASAGITSSVTNAFSVANAQILNLGGGNIDKGRQLKLNLGDVSNTGTNNIISLIYNVVVLNASANVQGVTRKNTISWTSTECNVSAMGPTVKIVEPKLQLTKTPINPANGQPITSADAGDTLTWVLTITNNSPSDATAYQAQLSDVIPAGHTYVNNSLMWMNGVQPMTIGGGTNGAPITVLWSQLALGESSMIKFQTIVSGDVVPCQKISNEATLSWMSIPPPPTTPISVYNPLSCPRTGNPSNCGELNNYSISAMGMVSVPGPTVMKTLKDTSASHTVGDEVTIGEEIIYELKVCLPDSTIPSINLTDILPPGLVAVSAAVTQNNGITAIPIGPLPLNPANPQPGDDQSFNFTGPIVIPHDTNPNNNCFTVELKVRVSDVPGNMGMPGNQTLLDNKAVVGIGSPAMCTSMSEVVTVKVVEPKLGIRKSFDQMMIVEGGMVAINLSVTNTGTSDAFNVVVEDPLPTAIFDQVMEGAGTPTGFVFSAPVVGSNTVATFTGGTVPKGQVRNFQIKATIKRRCLGYTYNNKATITRAQTLESPMVGRNESGAMAEALLVIKPSPDCECYELSDTQFGSLVEWLRFNELSGDNAFDSGSFLNHGQLKLDATTGPSRVANGAVMGALSFDGMNDFVEAPPTNSLNIGTGSVTVDAWIKPTAASVGPGSGIRPIVDKRTGTGGGTGNFVPSQDTATGYTLFMIDGQLSFQLGASNYFNYVSVLPQGQIPPNTWSHVTAVVTRVNGSPFKVELFVNGQSVYVNTNDIISGNADNTAPLFVGRRHPLPIALDERYFAGEIDEVEIFTRALDQHEIDGIVRAGSKGKCRCVDPPRYGRMVGWWPLDGNGNDIRGGHNGTATGVGGTFPDAMVKQGWQSGGVGSLVSVPDHNALDVESFSVDAWVTINSLNPANMPIVYKGNPQGTNLSTSIALGVTSASDPPAQRLLAIISNGSTDLVVRSTANLPLGVPVHVAATGAVTFNGGIPTTNLCVYVNGVLDSCQSKLNIKPQNSPYPFQIGAGINNNQNYFNGVIDEVELWNEGLTEAELRSIYLAYSAGKCKCAEPPRYDRMISWHPLDEAAGVTTIKDIRGPHNGQPKTGAVNSTNSPMAMSGKVNGSLYFNGNGTFPHVEVPHAPSLDLVSDEGFTIDAWINVDQLQTDQKAPIVDKMDYVPGTPPSVKGYAFYVQRDAGGNQLVFDIGANNGTQFSINTTAVNVLASGNWHHVAISYDRNNGAAIARFYVDGQQVVSSGSPANDKTVNTLPLLIGKTRYTNNENEVGGIKIDELEIFDVPLTQGEINTIFMADKAGKCRPLCINTNITLTSQPNPLPIGMTGMPYPETQLIASGGAAPYMYSATGLPAGLSLSMDGKLTGTPTQQGNSTFTITVKDANGCMVEIRREIVIKCREYSIKPDLLPVGYVGSVYPKQTFTTDSTCPPVTYTVSGLPPGLSFANGMLQGTPTQAGSFTVTVSTIDACGCPSRKTYPLVIKDCPRVMLKLFNTGVDNNRVPMNLAVPDGHYVATGTNGGIAVPTVIDPQPNWVMSPGARWIGKTQPGINRFSTTFDLSGCDLTSVSISGKFAANIGGQLFLNNSTTPIATNNGPTSFTNFTINSGFQAGPNTLTFVVTPGPSINGLLVEFGDAFAKCCECPAITIGPNVSFFGNRNQPFSPASLTASGGMAPYGYSIIGGALPTGMNLSSAGVLSGTPTVAGIFKFKVLVVDAMNCTGMREYQILIRRRLIGFDYNVSTNQTFAPDQSNRLTLRINMEALGNEKAWSFSLGFNSAVLSNPRVTLGADAAGGTLNVNTSQVGQGAIGMAITLPGNQTLASGSRQIFLVVFDYASVNTGAKLDFEFRDTPVARSVTDTSGSSLPTEVSASPVVLATKAAIVSAASYGGERLASEQIVAAFGLGLATTTQVATTVPLPTSLAGTTIKVRDSASVERLAPLFFVAPTQINYLIPAGTASGTASIIITSGDGTVSGAVVEIANVAPGIFVADASGRGLPAANALTFKPDGSSSSNPVARFDPASSRFVAVPIDLGAIGGRVFLSLFGTGVRRRSSLEAVRAIIGGVEAPLQFAGDQGGFAGLDQINIELPRSLAGSGLVDVTLIVDGQIANVVQVSIR